MVMVAACTPKTALPKVLTSMLFKFNEGKDEVNIVAKNRIIIRFILGICYTICTYKTGHLASLKFAIEIHCVRRFLCLEHLTPISMIRKFYLLALLLSVGATCSAQRFNWSSSAGYPGINNSYEGTKDMAVDTQGNVYVFDSANLGQESQGVTVDLNGSGTNVFLYKFDPNGVLVWGRSVGSDAGILTPLNLEFGSDGNLYVLIHANCSTLISGLSTFPISGPVNAILRLDLEGHLDAVYSTGLSCSTCNVFEIANDKIYFQSGNSELRSIDFDLLTQDEFSFVFEPATALMAMPFTNASVFSNGDLLFAAVQRGDATFIEGETLTLEGNSGLYSNLTYVRFSESLQPIWAKTFPYSHMPAEDKIPLSIDANDQVFTGLEILNVTTIGDVTINGDFNVWAGTLLSLDADGNVLWVDELEAVTSARILSLFSDQETGKTWMSIFVPSSVELGGETVNGTANGCPVVVDVNSAGDFGTNVVLSELPGGSKGLSLEKGVNGQYFLGGMLNSGSDYTINCITYPGAKGLFVASFLDIPANPPAPTITTEGNGIMTASPEFEGTIQWYLNGEPIDGANSQVYQATVSGTYSVVYSYDFGCVAEATSGVEEVVVTGLNEEGISVMNVYPNPSSDLVWISGAKGANTIVELLDATGKVIYRSTLVGDLKSFSVADFAKGMYMLRVYSERSIVSSVLIVQ